MAKKVQAYVKPQVAAGMANPNPPVGPALGQQGMDIMEFCKAFNAKTDSAEKGLPIPVVITVYADRSFTFVTKTPPTTVLLKKAAGIRSGSGKPNKGKMGKISRAQLQEVAQTKTADMTGADTEAMTHSIEGTARSMDLVVENQEMTKLTKRMRIIREKIDAAKRYDINETIILLKELTTAEFVENVGIAVNLSIGARKSDQSIRDATVLPHGTDRSVRVAAFTQGADAEAAKAAGAELVGMEDLAEQIKKGEMNFDVVIAFPDVIRVVGQLDQVLGSRGLMPNPKAGTVTPNVAEAVKNTKTSQIRYRSDKNGIIHTTIGKVDFGTDKLRKNLEALLVALKKVKPTQAEGVHIKKVSISVAMGTGVIVDQADLSAFIN